MNFLQLFHSASQFNYYGFDSDSYDELLNQLLTTNPEKREGLIARAERILVAEAPMIPLYHYVSRHLVRANIVGYENNVLDQHLSRYIRLK